MTKKNTMEVPVFTAPDKDLSPLSITGNRIMRKNDLTHVDQALEPTIIVSPAEMQRQGTCVVHFNAGCGFPTMTMPPRRSGFIPPRDRELG